MYPDKGVPPLTRITNYENAVYCHRIRENCERLLHVSFPEFIGEFRRFAEFGMPHTRVPLNFVLPALPPERQRYRSEDAYGTSSWLRRGSRICLLAFRVDTNQLALVDEPIAYVGINIGKHVPSPSASPGEDQYS